MSEPRERFPVDTKRRKKIEECVKVLTGITYPEWIEIKRLLDADFEKRIRKLKYTLDLSDSDYINQLIQSLFESGWD